MERFGNCLAQGTITTVMKTALMKSGETPKMPEAMSPAYWYEKAAEAGHTDAWCRLGELYRTGKTRPTEPVRALQLCLRAAQAGSVWAQRKVANHFAAQSTFDFAQAAYWYQRAAIEGDAPAAYALGELFYHNATAAAEHFNLQGRHHKDYAREWYEVAAGLGFEPAYAKTAILYHQKLEETLKQQQDITKESAAVSTLMAKAYVWLSASQSIHQPDPITGQISKRDNRIFVSVESKLQELLLIMPNQWMPELDKKVVAHLGKYPSAWTTNADTPKQLIARYTYP